MERFVSNPTYGSKKWIPELEDVLLVRSRTVGVVEKNLTVKNVKFNFIDFGGQQQRIKDYENCFSGVTAVIYVAALSDYNLTLVENQHINRLQHSISLFHQLVKNPNFAQSGIILFLNKEDLFMQKYKHNRIPINDPATNFFPGAPTEADEIFSECSSAKEWLREQFLEDLPSGREVYVYFTNALDRERMKKIFDSCASHILQDNMRLTGLVPLD